MKLSKKIIQANYILETQQSALLELENKAVT